MPLNLATDLFFEFLPIRPFDSLVLFISKIALF
jgi:hypothetical protein